MKKNKLTKKEKFIQIQEMLNEKGEMDLAYFISKEIEHLDKKADRAKVVAAKKKEEVDILKETVYGVLDAEEYKTIADIVASIADEKVTNSKVSYRLNTLVKEERVERVDLSIPTGDGNKTRRVKGFKKI